MLFIDRERATVQAQLMLTCVRTALDGSVPGVVPGVLYAPCEYIAAPVESTTAKPAPETTSWQAPVPPLLPLDDPEEKMIWPLLLVNTRLQFCRAAAGGKRGLSSACRRSEQHARQSMRKDAGYHCHEQGEGPRRVCVVGRAGPDRRRERLPKQFATWAL